MCVCVCAQFCSPAASAEVLWVVDETTATLSAGIPAEAPAEEEVEAADDVDEELAFLGATTTLLEEHRTQIGTRIDFRCQRFCYIAIVKKRNLADGASFGLEEEASEELSTPVGGRRTESAAH